MSRKKQVAPVLLGAEGPGLTPEARPAWASTSSPLGASRIADVAKAMRSMTPWSSAISRLSRRNAVRRLVKASLIVPSSRRFSLRRRSTLWE